MTVTTGGQHRVRRGETLSEIARRHGTTVGALMEANPQIDDADRIDAGQTLRIRRLRAPPLPTAPVVASQDPTMPFATPGLGGALELPVEPSGTSSDDVPVRARYVPGSPEQIALFRAAARRAGLPESWASAPGLVNILKRESDGQVGRPNYTYGARSTDPSQWGRVHAELRKGIKSAKSSATGLGQLLLANVDRYYPSGRFGIGNAIEEAIGMMRYIKDRYGSPERAWALYGKKHEGY